MTDFLQQFWLLLLDAAPWLVLGLIIGGLFKSMIPSQFLAKHLSGNGGLSIIKAALLGAPLPLCSCGVIPAAMALRQSGAGKPATTSFLVSTPETGIDSVTVTYAMMGPLMAIIRPISALFSAITTGLMVLLFDQENQSTMTAPKQSSCCGSNSASEEKPIPVKQAIFDGLRYAFVDLYLSILKWLLIGLVFAALVQTLVPTDWLIYWGQSAWAMLVMLLIGIPMYVCATASTPLAAGFLMAGISPGAVLVFLLAGPATNMATLGVVAEQLGKRTMLIYLLSIMSTALFSGWLVNLWMSDIDLQNQLHASHGMVPTSLAWLSVVVLIVIPLWHLYQNSKPKSCCG
ncbi:MAG: SO_0444 family Cu/Zn efflux transporter [Marinicella sp.]